MHVTMHAALKIIDGAYYGGLYRLCMRNKPKLNPTKTILFTILLINNSIYYYLYLRHLYAG